jgi:hypothetical protein
MTEAYPLKWPDGWKRTPSHQRKTYSRFNTTFDAARRKLMAELKLLQARNVVVSSWLPLKNDGTPYANAARMKMEDPGVAVYFELNKRPMVMARDAFTSIHDNLTSLYHAIAHLRGLERHGGAAMMERAFGGFVALNAPSKLHWTAVLGYPGNWRELTPETQKMWIQSRFAALAKERHPDMPGGSEEAFRLLAEARQAALANVGEALAPE